LLFWSSRRLCTVMLDMIIDDGRFDFSKKAPYDNYILEVARRSGDVQLVRKVISQLNLSVKPEYWDDVLSDAAYYHQIEIVDEY